MIKRLLDRPVPATILVVVLLLTTTWAVTYSPRSILVFLMFQGSVLLLYFARMPPPLKAGLTILTLGVLMPYLGAINAYYMEIAIQVGIFAALALGLNIVVGLAGLLDLGYVAFFAVGAYSWAIFGSPQANLIFGGQHFPLGPWWFFVFLLVGVAVTATAGILLGLPVLRLHGDYLALVTLGFGEVIRVLASRTAPRASPRSTARRSSLPPCSRPSASTRIRT